MARAKSALIEQLNALKAEPAQQGALAATLLAGKQSKDVLMAAVAVLATSPQPAAAALPVRSDLLRLYAEHAANKGVRDPGAYFRRGLIEALRPIAHRDDAAVFAQAAATYEFWPPDFAEDAVLLRSAGLVALAGVDDEAARFHAARLLVDPYVQPMSGEPAVTAARVLGALGELTVLWSYVMAEHPPQLAEVTAECLRQLQTLPETLLPALIERFGREAPLPSRLGLVDLLINHPATSRAENHKESGRPGQPGTEPGEGGRAGRACLLGQLQETRDIDVFRYLVMSIVAAGHEPLLAGLLACAQNLQNREKLAVLAEAFTLLAHQPQFREQAAAIQRRLAGNRRR